jgi:hypothetical protein
MPTLKLIVAAFALGVAAQGSHPIVGVQSGKNIETGEVPARKNINDLARDGGPQL